MDSASRVLPAHSIWHPVMTNYAALNDRLGEVAPALAAEATAGMALSAHDAGQPEFAELLLGKALHYYRSARANLH